MLFTLFLFYTHLYFSFKSNPRVNSKSNDFDSALHLTFSLWLSIFVLVWRRYPPWMSKGVGEGFEKFDHKMHPPHPLDFQLLCIYPPKRIELLISMTHHIFQGCGRHSSIRELGGVHSSIPDRLRGWQQRRGWEYATGNH